MIGTAGGITSPGITWLSQNFVLQLFWNADLAVLLLDSCILSFSSVSSRVLIIWLDGLVRIIGPEYSAIIVFVIAKASLIPKSLFERVAVF